MKKGDPSEPKKPRKRQAITPERLAELRAMPYADYLKTVEWYRRRAVLLKFADNRCQLCYTDKGPFNCHHRTYERLGQERLSDLVLLCQPCHQNFHNQRTLHKEPRKAVVKPTPTPRKIKFVDAPLPDETWAPGETAIHPKFGKCLILSVDPHKEYVTVQYERTNGVRVLSLRYAKLQKLLPEVN